MEAGLQGGRLAIFPQKKKGESLFIQAFPFVVCVG